MICEPVSLRSGRVRMRSHRSKKSGRGHVGPERRVVFIGVKALATNWDCSRTTVSRILEEAGIHPYYFGSGRNGPKRYLKADTDHFLRSLPQPE